MNDPSQHELDDELLSAYLDDELSPSERALVENRLAADSAARQTLEHLRSVSQSVRDLPEIKLGRDLRESILRRAAAARMEGPESLKGVTPGLQHPAPSTHLPTITIGRTMRGWVWATVAVAAAVLIMVLQPGDDQDTNLAERRALTENEAARNQERSDETSIPAAAKESSPATPAPMPQDVAADYSAETNKDVAAFSSEGRATSDSFATQLPTEEPIGESATPADAAPADAPKATQPETAASGGDHSPIVVHVLAKRDAFEKNAFEDLLRKCDVTVEPAAPQIDATGLGAGGEPESVASRDSQSQAARAPARKEREPDNVALLLVDAPSNTIVKCMSELNGDADNFPGVSVDDSATHEGAAAKTVPAITRGTDLKKFNRGIAPSADARAHDAEQYFVYLGDDQQFLPRYGGGFGGLATSKRLEEKQGAQTAESNHDRGLARRLQLRYVDDNAKKDESRYGEIVASQPPGDAKAVPQIRDKLQAAAANGERMQVLFVLRPTDEPAPSLKAKN